MFAEERPHLLPLPLEPFRYYQYGHPHRASRRLRRGGRRLLRAPAGLARPRDRRAVGRPPRPAARSHYRDLAPGTSPPAARPARDPSRGSARAHAPHHADTSRPAARAGAPIGTLCEAIHRRDSELGVRRIFGVLALVKKHGAAIVADACTVALELGVADYRFVRRYLERQAPAPLTIRQVDPLIRELTHYRDVIARKTQEVTP
jgi:hypothetical protein